jgi:hypothetical protein
MSLAVNQTKTVKMVFTVTKRITTVEMLMNVMLIMEEMMVCTSVVATHLVQIIISILLVLAKLDLKTLQIMMDVWTKMNVQKEVITAN